MRVLVTGNLGYIGPMVVRHLREAGHYVFGLDVGFFLPNYAALPEFPDEQVFCDLRDCSYSGVVYDAVVHLAGLSNDPLGAIDPVLTYGINAEGTIGMFWGKPGARHIVVSSCAVYGASSEIATEDSPTNPLTYYAISKRVVERWVADNADEALNVATLRLGTAYGWSPGHRLDLVVNRMTYDAVHGKGVSVMGNAARPLVHVEDVARAIVFMLDRPETGIYNVVGENYRMADLAQEVRALTGATVINKPAGADARDYMASGAKLRALGWEPRYTVAGSLPVLAEKTLGLSGPPTRYERLAALKRLIDTGALTPDLRRPERIAAA